MEPDVLRAMAKWPNVPDIYGWLALDRRGRWLLRGEPVTHPSSKAFIVNNYAVDTRGCWYFQNGPQRVFVDLACTPWIFRWMAPDWCHQGGKPISQLRRALIDPDGLLYLETNHGLGLVHHLDLAFAATQLCLRDGQPLTEEIEAALFMGNSEMELPRQVAFRWLDQVVPLERLPDSDVSHRFEFVLQPKAPFERPPKPS